MSVKRTPANTTKQSDVRLTSVLLLRFLHSEKHLIDAAADLGTLWTAFMMGPR